MNEHTPDPRPPDADELSRRLRSHGRSEGSRLPAPRGSAAAVTRARARRRNRRAMAASAAALVVLAASSYVIKADSGKEEVATAAQRAVVDPALGFDWTVTDDGLWYPNGSSAGDSGLYALSTAPGAKEEDYPNGGVPRAMYKLTPEGTWAPILLEGDDPSISRVSERGGTLYALSTGLASGQDGRPTGSISTDGGQSWSSVPLQMATAPSDAVDWRLAYTLDVDSTAEKTVALVTATVSVPYGTLFPELGDNDEGDLTVENTDEGISLLRRSQEDHERLKRESIEDPVAADGSRSPGTDEGPIGEVVRTVTWAELGITGPADLSAQRWAYVADGGDWVEVATPEPSGPLLDASLRLDATDDALILTANEVGFDHRSRTISYRSADGQSWEQLDLPGDGQLLTVGNSLVLITSTPDQHSTVQVSSDGATWSPLDLGSLDPAVADLAPDGWIQGSSGPLGIALVAADQEGTVRTLLFSTDLEHWSITDLNEVVPEGTYTGEVIVGTDRIVVLGHSSNGEQGSPERSATMTGVPRAG